MIGILKVLMKVPPIWNMSVHEMLFIKEMIMFLYTSLKKIAFVIGMWVTRYSDTSEFLTTLAKWSPFFDRFGLRWRLTQTIYYESLPCKDIINILKEKGKKIERKGGRVSLTPQNVTIKAKCNINKTHKCVKPAFL